MTALLFHPHSLREVERWSEYTEGQDPGLVLPEGYVAERYEDGRLRIYDTGTGGWLGRSPRTSQTPRRWPGTS